MDPAVISRLIDLNHQFYQTFAADFAATRQRIQPGVQRALADLDPHATLLDVGCGNGELARYLASRGHIGTYLGLDFSSKLLETAQNTLTAYPQYPARFELANLAEPDWGIHLPEASFDVALSFAVLHHLPGEKARQALLQEVWRSLVPGGCLVLSVWQFLNSLRLARRILPWETVGLDPQKVDPGDTLLDWRAGGLGLRYVHHFSEDELQSLAVNNGFEIQEQYYSDGKEGDLGLYQILWKKMHKAE